MHLTPGSSVARAPPSSSSPSMMSTSVKARPNTCKPTFDTLVVSGGGLKGVAALGAVHALRRSGALDNVKTMVGTSAGALVCAAMACGRDPHVVLRDLGPNMFKPDLDIKLLTTSFGIDSGSGIFGFADRVLGGRHTFRDIQQATGIRLVVCATNLSERRPEYFGPDTHPGMDVALALRMSCSVPLYFAAVRLGDATYVDGVLTDNFPCDWALDNGSTSVIGIRFKPRNAPIASLDGYLGALSDCAVRQGPRRSAAAARVVELDPAMPTSVTFNATRKETRALFASGYAQACDFIKKTE